ncbi:Hypothetical predicted protein [Mytilus galloprovincialis]|uniref:DDE Tnp4 domain-containing protein n=1 Tax=Mytilus galloprovincialis TaxID=29158 RepID=A0A8B6BX08_MYTGA|nr:Hypothetical predicted protein [Mytilus galloprovincialis]
MACFEYLEPKASRLQFWRGQNDTTDDYKHYQTQGGRPGPRRKMTLRDEFVMTLIRLKVGLFVRDLAERFEVSQMGVSPTGNVTFVSEFWGGRVSDKEITKQSGLLDLFQPGDNVMADRGFEIADILPEVVTLNIPPFKGTNKQLSAQAVEDTMSIASVRIHVERAIGRIKNYHILDGVLPLSLSHVASQIFRVVSFLTGFSPQLVPPKFDTDIDDEQKDEN